MRVLVAGAGSVAQGGISPQIEHRLFSFITQNWRGRPLLSYAVVVSLIAATTTAAGLTVGCALDTTRYPAGRKVSDAELASGRLELDVFHGDWKYTILPRHAVPVLWEPPRGIGAEVDALAGVVGDESAAS